MHDDASRHLFGNRQGHAGHGGAVGQHEGLHRDVAREVHGPTEHRVLHGGATGQPRREGGEDGAGEGDTVGEGHEADVGGHEDRLLMRHLAAYDVVGEARAVGHVGVQIKRVDGGGVDHCVGGVQHFANRDIGQGEGPPLFGQVRHQGVGLRVRQHAVVEDHLADGVVVELAGVGAIGLAEVHRHALVAHGHAPRRHADVVDARAGGGAIHLHGELVAVAHGHLHDHGLAGVGGGVGPAVRGDLAVGLDREGVVGAVALQHQTVVAVAVLEEHRVLLDGGLRGGGGHHHHHEVLVRVGRDLGGLEGRSEGGEPGDQVHDVHVAHVSPQRLPLVGGQCLVEKVDAVHLHAHPANRVRDFGRRVAIDLEVLGGTAKSGGGRAPQQLSVDVERNLSLSVDPGVTIQRLGVHPLIGLFELRCVPEGELQLRLIGAGAGVHAVQIVGVLGAGGHVHHVVRKVSMTLVDLEHDVEGELGHIEERGVEAEVRAARQTVGAVELQILPVAVLTRGERAFRVVHHRDVVSGVRHVLDRIVLYVGRIQGHLDICNVGCRDQRWGRFVDVLEQGGELFGDERLVEEVHAVQPHGDATSSIIMIIIRVYRCSRVNIKLGHRSE